MEKLNMKKQQTNKKNSQRCFHNLEATWVVLSPKSFSTKA